MTKRELLERLEAIEMDDEIFWIEYYDSKLKEYANDIKLEGLEAYQDLRGRWVLDFNINTSGAYYLMDDKEDSNEQIPKSTK